MASSWASAPYLCNTPLMQEIVTDLSVGERTGSWHADRCVLVLCYGSACSRKGEAPLKGHWTPELGSGAWQLFGGASLHLGSVNTSTIYSYLVQRNSISPELFYFSKPGLYQIFPQLLNSSINVVCYLFFWHVFISWKTSTLCLTLGMSCWIPFRILLNLEVNQITFFYYKHIRLGFHMRCCMGEWAQSTPAGATALFM